MSLCTIKACVVKLVQEHILEFSIQKSEVLLILSFVVLKLLSGSKKLLLNKSVKLQIKKFKLSGKISANYHENISTEDNRKKIEHSEICPKRHMNVT